MDLHAIASWISEHPTILITIGLLVLFATLELEGRLAERRAKRILKHGGKP